MHPIDDLLLATGKEVEGVELAGLIVVATSACADLLASQKPDGIVMEIQLELKIPLRTSEREDIISSL